MRRIATSLLFLVALVGHALAWGTPGSVNVANPQVGAPAGSAGLAPINDNFAAGGYPVAGGVCSEWGHRVPCTNHVSTSRASTGYAQTAAGVLVPFAANVLRITDQGALIEEARTNLAPYSEDFTNWGLTGVTRTQGQIDPANNSKATLITAIAGAGYHNVFGANTTSINSGEAYSASAYVKPGSTRYTAVAEAGDSVWHTAVVDWNTNTIVTNTNLVSSSITPAANGFYRVVLNITKVTTGTSYILIGPAIGTNGTSPTNFTAAGTETCYGFGGQIELGSFPTSYIPTTTAAATRAADVPQLIGPALTAALAAKSAFFQTYGVAGTTGNNRLLSDASSNYMTFNNSTQVRIINPTGNADANAGSGNYTATAKTAFGFDASGVSAIFNAGTKVTSATAWTGTAPFYIGNVSSGIRALNGYMQRFALSPIKGVFDGATAP